MPITVNHSDGRTTHITGEEFTTGSSSKEEPPVSNERVRVYIDDASGKQIASPNDATNGGSRQLQGDEAKRWLKENPDLALKSTARPEDKAADKPEDKSVGKSETKSKA